MDHSERWTILNEIGEGGQGKVFSVIPKNEGSDNLKVLRDVLGELTTPQYQNTQEAAYTAFKSLIQDIVRKTDPAHHGALKVLHSPADARDFARSEERIKREIAAMQNNQGPNLIEILDTDPEGRWFVSKFYPRGTLARQANRFKGDFAGALRALRSVVEAVAKLHKSGYVHRDIKPENIFVSPESELILGDFGLVLFTDSSHTRISDTYENVGSRDWMPTWAMGVRVEDIQPNFDVFSLGKTLWAMVSGKQKLNLWYYDEPENNVEILFPKAPYIRLANELFKKCIVERARNCLPDGHSLLNEIDELLQVIALNGDKMAESGRKCRVCGRGRYVKAAHQTATPTINEFGLHPKPEVSYKIFLCDYCGNMQLFWMGLDPPAWS
jgi:serine/threonine protein kinase